MNIRLRPSEPSDMPFLREMLYEGVYWRTIAKATNPPFEEGLTAPGVRNALVNWGEWEGDSAVVARVDAHLAGAAWYRFYTEDNAIRGYIEDAIPALVIAVHRDYRRQGIGTQLIEWLIDHASTHNIHQMSLMVSKDNHAIHLYRQCGFLDYADRGDSLLMLRKIPT
ncbi:MAG: GNAT family N-acetyltransferase [bacterium]|nr:GNAT family N-acetyltransferase [bacterium]